MHAFNIKKEFPELQPEILEIAVALQNLALRVFPTAEVTADKENIGFGFGSGYKTLVFVLSPFRQHVNLAW